MTIEIIETARAEQQVDALRGPQRRIYESFLNDFTARGCAALGYRLTGDHPLARLCVKHLGRLLRVVVAFESAARAWVLLVGPHDELDPDIDVYTEVYRLAGVTPPIAKRTKPACCSPDGAAPLLDLEALELTQRAVKLRRTRSRAQPTPPKRRDSIRPAARNGRPAQCGPADARHLS